MIPLTRPLGRTFNEAVADEQVLGLYIPGMRSADGASTGVTSLLIRSPPPSFPGTEGGSSWLGSRDALGRMEGGRQAVRVLERVNSQLELIDHVLTVYETT